MSRTVTLRDILTDDDRAAALRVRRGPGDERFAASVEKSFADAVLDARAAPRFWTINDGDEVVASPNAREPHGTDWRARRRGLAGGTVAAPGRPLASDNDDAE